MSRTNLVCLVRRYGKKGEKKSKHRSHGLQVLTYPDWAAMGGGERRAKAPEPARAVSGVRSPGRCWAAGRARRGPLPLCISATGLLEKSGLRDLQGVHCSAPPTPQLNTALNQGGTEDANWINLSRSHSLNLGNSQYRSLRGSLVGAVSSHPAPSLLRC